jgi:thioredoxin-related protein
MLSNGTYFSGKSLPKGRPVLLIYFQPDCDHCQKLMDAMFKRIKEFRNTDIVMVTFKPVDELTGFEQRYQTFKFPNIKVGTEGTTYFLRYYYKLETTPFTALFDKKGKLVYSYRKETSVEDLIGRLRKLTATSH